MASSTIFSDDHGAGLMASDAPASPAVLAAAWIRDAIDDAPGDADTAGLLLQQVKPIAPELTCEELHELFTRLNPDLHALPVVSQGRPIGIVSRYDVVEKFSKRYFRELYGKKAVVELMNAAPLVVDCGLSLDELGLKVARQDHQALADGFILTDQGVYMGMGTGQALLRELTERKQAHLASALEKATEKLRLAQAELLEKQRMQQELAIAQEIQAALLPKAMPEIPGYRVAAYYRPALEVGGDYFDFIPLSGGRQALVVADVSGKGVPGSLGMAMTRSVLRAQAPYTQLPGETLRRANEILHPDLRSGMFITVFYSVLDPQQHRLSCACGGHHPALHVGEQGLRPVAPEGMALGLGPKHLYFVDEGGVDMRPGDLFVLYTDGVLEAMNPAEEEYGEERFAASLARQAGGDFDGLAARLVRDIADFTQGAAQTDDITLVILRRDPAA